MARTPDYEQVINGRVVKAWKRREYIEVFVYDVDGELTGEWEMPTVLGVELAAKQAELQSREE